MRTTYVTREVHHCGQPWLWIEERLCNFLQVNAADAFRVSCLSYTTSSRNTLLILVQEAGCVRRIG